MSIEYLLFRPEWACEPRSPLGREGNDRLYMYNVSICKYLLMLKGGDSNE